MKVVDTSVAVKWFVTEVRKAAADGWLDAGEALVAPDLLLVEVANTCWRKVRAGELVENQADEIVATLPTLVDLVPERSDLAAALALATALDHPVYDCLYLALGLRLDVEVVTDDTRFHRAVTESSHAGRTILLDGPR